ncbi:MAG: SDR family oxidoreductase [Cyanobacteria bacterium]|nr:SDR family oxidoreductase [Cyanobacteriota bacterium]
MKKLENKTVLIVGASSGIGLATAQLASEAGAHVILCSRSLERLLQAQTKIPGPSKVIAFDSLKEDEVSAALDPLVSVDHLVITAVADENNLRSPLASMSTETAHRGMEKFWTSFYVSRALASKIPPSGSITLTSSVSIYKPSRDGGVSVMSAASGAVAVFGRTLAAELAPIRVNVLVPGVVDSGVWASKTEEEIQALRTWGKESLPVGHLGQPEELAEAVLFLMTNPYVTGQLLSIDGGLAFI